MTTTRYRSLVALVTLLATVGWIFINSMRLVTIQQASPSPDSPSVAAAQLPPGTIELDQQQLVKLLEEAAPPYAPLALTLPDFTPNETVSFINALRAAIRSELDSRLSDVPTKLDLANQAIEFANQSVQNVMWIGCIVLAAAGIAVGASGRHSARE